MWNQVTHVLSRDNRFTIGDDRYWISADCDVFSTLWIDWDYVRLRNWVFCSFEWIRYCWSPKLCPTLHTMCTSYSSKSFRTNVRVIESIFKFFLRVFCLNLFIRFFISLTLRRIGRHPPLRLSELGLATALRILSMGQILLQQTHQIWCAVRPNDLLHWTRLVELCARLAGESTFIHSESARGEQYCDWLGPARRIHEGRPDDV
jgi:hypothetical protein